jgi:modulator of FtsH protease HflK
MSRIPEDQELQRLKDVADQADAAAEATVVVEPLDPAQQSLADALRVMFFLLKLVMIGLVVGFLWTGCYTVQPQEVGIRLFMGRIVGADHLEQIVPPGGPYFAAPYPVMQVLKVPTTSRNVRLTDSFWFQRAAPTVGMTAAEQQQFAGPIDPERHGSLLTGDANIVHAQWVITYGVHDPVSFVHHIPPAEIDESGPGGRIGFDPSDPQQLMRAADRLIARVGEQAIIFTVAQVTADQVHKGLGPGEFDVARQHMQQTLDHLRSGLRVENVSATEIRFPLTVRDAFEAVTRAESERARQIEDAQRERATILGGTAGEAFAPLLRLVEAYATASSLDDQEEMNRLKHELDQAFTTLTITDARQRSVRVGGRVAETLNEALVYRTQVAQRTESQAAYFLTLKQQYDVNPRVVLDRLWQDAVQTALSDDTEVLFVPPDWRPYLEINRDPEKWREREARRLEGR